MYGTREESSGHPQNSPGTGSLGEAPQQPLLFGQASAEIPDENTGYFRTDSKLNGRDSSELRHLVSFTAGEEFIQKLNRARELCRNGGGSLSGVLEAALDESLHRHCPLERAARRRTRRGEKAEVNAEELVREEAAGEPAESEMLEEEQELHQDTEE